MNDNFKLYSQYYDLLNADKDYNAETNYVDQLIKKYNQNSKSILELGSGTGKHAYLLAELGYQVFGIERSAEMVAIANQKKHTNVKFKVADITNFKLNQSFDVATSLFHVISYLTDNKSLIQTFKNVYQHLKTDGIFIFDVWHSSAVHHLIPEKRTKKLQDENIAVWRNANPISYPELNIVEIEYDITITNLKDLKTEKIFEKHPMRYFSKPEIEILAFATGFELVYTEEFETRKVPSIATWGVCYILKKI